MLDNAPAWFKVKHLKNQLLIFIVDNTETLVQDLDVHLNKTKKSLQQICFDLLEDNDLNYAIDFIISALSLMLEIPILMVCPIQHKSKTNEIYYSYQEIFPTEEQKNNTSANSKICLIWNVIDTFIPFLNISIAEIYNLGVPAMRSVFDVFNSCKDLVKFVPSKSSLKGATTEIVGHLRAALKLAATVHFTDGSSGFSPEELEGEELQPTGDPLKTVETQKQRKLPPAETETSATKKSKTATEVNPDVPQAEDAAQATQSTSAVASATTKKKRTDCDRDEFQCYCGKKFKDDDRLQKHKNRYHSNGSWMCSGMVTDKKGNTSDCQKMCLDGLTLWNHF